LPSGLILLAAIIYVLAARSSSLGWRIEALQADIAYFLDPPEKKIFVPASNTPAIATPTPPPSLTPSPTIQLATPAPTITPTQPLPPTQTATPLPAQAQLGGILHMYQMWNNCGPANLAMNLTYWGWVGDQRDTAAFLKPNDRDKNVMPSEMEAYVETQANLQAVVRVGGDIQMLKAFMSAGYPVIVGFEGEGFDGWMGHYEVVSGYDDARVSSSSRIPKARTGRSPMISLSVIGAPSITLTMVIYPAELCKVLNILGLQSYDNLTTYRR
jgi:hypothetical protein